MFCVGLKITLCNLLKNLSNYVHFVNYYYYSCLVNKYVVKNLSLSLNRQLIEIHAIINSNKYGFISVSDLKLAEC